MNISNLFKKDIGIKESFVVKDGLFAESSYLFVANADGTYSLYSYPKLVFLCGADIHSRGFLKDNYDGKVYDITRGQNLYNLTALAYPYNDLIDEYKKSLENEYDTKSAFDLSFLSEYYQPTVRDETLKKAVVSMRKLKGVCALRNISYETDPIKIMERIVNRIEANPDLLFPGMKEPTVSFCTSVENINDYCDKKTSEFKTSRDFQDFAGDVYGIRGATGRIIFKYFGHLLSNNHLLYDAIYLKTDSNANDIIREYMEFVLVFPYFSSLLAAANKKANECMAKAEIMSFDNFYKNPDFINELNSIVNHEAGHTFLYHATTDIDSANRILNEGLYAYSENLSSTTCPELDVNQILSYGYGNGVNMYDRFVVVIDAPDGEEIIRKMSPEEREKANIFPRRMAVCDKPDYVIDSKYVVGYVDKLKMKVIYNPSYGLTKESGRN